MLEVLAYGRRGKKLRILSFCIGSLIKILCTRFGAERPTSHFSQDMPFTMVVILAVILEIRVDEKLHLNATVLCANFGYKRPDDL